MPVVFVFVVFLGGCGDGRGGSGLAGGGAAASGGAKRRLRASSFDFHAAAARGEEVLRSRRGGAWAASGPGRRARRQGPRRAPSLSLCRGNERGSVDEPPQLFHFRACAESERVALRLRRARAATRGEKHRSSSRRTRACARAWESAKPRARRRGEKCPLSDVRAFSLPLLALLQRPDENAPMAAAADVSAPL